MKYKLDNPFRNQNLNQERKNFLIDKMINRYMEFQLEEDYPTEIINRTKIWKNSKGRYHRENDLPAIIYENGSKQWYQNGKIHRDNGPALILENGRKEWWVNGFLHREDGPARILSNGTEEYWILGEPMNKEDWRKKIEKI